MRTSSPAYFLRKNFSRRVFLRQLAALPLLGFLPACEYLEFQSNLAINGPGLGSLAHNKNRVYGAAVQSKQLADMDFANALRQEAGMLVPENELKWSALRPAADKFDFTGYQRIANFAQANNMQMRGHVLVWHQANPAWLAPALSDKGKAEKILEAHIKGVLAVTAPIIRNWDVVNEALDAHSKRNDGLRESPWLKALGPDYISLAYNIAHRADPDLTLVYNDFGLERDDADSRRKRQYALRLLDQLARNKVPVHALGLQSHLQAHVPLAGKEFSEFLKEVRNFGLKICITELDLNLSHLRGRVDDKIRIAQHYLRTYLDQVQKSGAVEMLLTWGLSDRYSWLKQSDANIAGALPLTRDLARGPMWDSLKESWLGA